MVCRAKEEGHACCAAVAVCPAAVTAPARCWLKALAHNLSCKATSPRAPALEELPSALAGAPGGQPVGVDPDAGLAGPHGQALGKVPGWGQGCQPPRASLKPREALPLGGALKARHCAGASAASTLVLSAAVCSRLGSVLAPVAAPRSCCKPLASLRARRRISALRMAACAHKPVLLSCLSVQWGMQRCAIQPTSRKCETCDVRLPQLVSYKASIQGLFLFLFFVC